MRVLVTGGSGFIGSRLCAVLAGAGHDVTVLSRRADALPPGSRRLSSLAAWTPDLQFDAVVNLAGAPIADAAWTAARKRELRDSRVELTRALVACIARARHRPAVLLSGSAIGYYGDRGDAGCAEDTPPGDDFAAVLCVDWEAAAAAVASLGVRVCLLRTGLVLDPAGGLLRRLLPTFRLGLGARLGDGRQWMSWITREDHVAAMLRLLEQDGLSGPFNLTAPEPVTNREFTAALARSLHRPALAVAPAPVLRLALGERAPLLLGGQRVLPARLLQEGYTFRHPTLDAALRDLLV